MHLRDTPSYSDTDVQQHRVRTVLGWELLVLVQIPMLLKGEWTELHLALTNREIMSYLCPSHVGSFQIRYKWAKSGSFFLSSGIHRSHIGMAARFSTVNRTG